MYSLSEHDRYVVQECINRIIVECPMESNDWEYVNWIAHNILDRYNQHLAKKLSREPQTWLFDLQEE